LYIPSKFYHRYRKFIFSKLSQHHRKAIGYAGETRYKTEPKKWFSNTISDAIKSLPLFTPDDGEKLFSKAPFLKEH